MKPKREGVMLVARKKKKAEISKKKLADIKAEYIVGEKSLRALALEHETSEGKLFRHSSKEGWRRAREEYRSKVTAEAIASAQTRAIQDVSEVLNMTKTLAGEIQLALGDPKQLYRRIVSDPNGKLVERDDFTKIDAKAVKDLAAALEKIATVATQLGAQQGAGARIEMNDMAKEYAE